MGKIGRTYPTALAAHTNSASASARFDRPLGPDQELTMRHQISAEVFGLVCFLAFVGWVLGN